MYIRRKVFSTYVDEYGEERYFSTTEFINEDTYLEEAMYSDDDNAGAIAAGAGLAGAAGVAGAGAYGLNKYNGMKNTANEKNLAKAKKAAQKSLDKELKAINNMDFAGKGKKTGAQMRKEAIAKAQKANAKVVKGLEKEQAAAAKQLGRFEKKAGKYLGEGFSKGKVGKWLAKNPKTALAAGAVGAGSIAAGAGYSTRKAID